MVEKRTPPLFFTPLLSKDRRGWAHFRFPSQEGSSTPRSLLVTGYAFVKVDLEDESRLRCRVWGD